MWMSDYPIATSESMVMLGDTVELREAKESDVVALVFNGSIFNSNYFSGYKCILSLRHKGWIYMIELSLSTKIEEKYPYGSMFNSSCFKHYTPVFSIPQNVTMEYLVTKATLC
jgi:hypothetical protein